jgi:hypothetical protein
MRETHALTTSWSWLLSRALLWQRGRAARLGALVVTLLAAVGLAGCDSGDPSDIAIAVSVTGLTTTATKLVVNASLDGKPAMQPLDLPTGTSTDLSRFGVRLPIDSMGSLTLSVEAFDSASCRVAQGSVSVALGAPFRFTTSVAMMTLATRECPPPSGPPSCAPATFCWSSPLPSGNAYLGLWANTASDVWAVGEVGTAVHFDGNAWTRVSTNATASLRGVWAASASDVWAVGDGGTILHYDGQSWQQASSGTTQSLTAVWGDGTSVWAVGQMGTIVRYSTSQKSWSASASGTTSQLNAVWATGPSAVYAVGNGGTAVKFDGSKWNAVSTAGGNLYGVGGDATHVFAVGDNGSVQQYNNTAFATVSTMNGLTLTAVWSPTAGQFVAVGSGGTVLRSTGTTWSADPAATNTQVTLRAVRSSSAGTPIFAAGDSGTLLSFDGGKWSTVSGGSSAIIRSMYGFAANDIWAVGTGGLVLHYDGTNWTPNSPPGVTSNLNGVWGSSPHNVWVVGDARTIQIWNGGSWTQRMVLDPMTTDLNGVYGFDSDTWVVGNSSQTNPVSARILHESGAGETALGLDKAQFLLAVWGSSTNDVWVVAPSGIVHVLNGGSGGSYPVVPTTAQMRALWGTSAQDVWAVGDGGNVMHYDGSQWVSAASEATQALRGVWGTSTTNAWAVGDNGALAIFNGTKWGSSESGTRNNLLAVWGSSDKDVWAGGAGQSLLHAQK